MNNNENKNFNSDNIGDYFLVVWGFLSFVVFPLLTIICLIWEFEIFYSSNDRDMYLSEKVTYGGSIFKKYHKVNFKIYPETQTIIQTNEQPIYTDEFKVKYRLDFKCVFNKNRTNIEKCKMSGVDKDKRQYLKSLPEFKQSITKLENCLVKNEENWICNSDIKHINLPIKFFGLKNGNWIIDDVYKSNIKKWKLFWYFQKFQCDDTCYQISVKEQNEGLEKFNTKFREKLKKQIHKN